MLLCQQTHRTHSSYHLVAGQATWALCAVECDIRSGRGSIRASARARPPTKKELFQIIPMHMMTREIIPSRKTGLDGVLYKL